MNYFGQGPGNSSPSVASYNLYTQTPQHNPHHGPPSQQQHQQQHPQPGQQHGQQPHTPDLHATDANNDKNKGSVGGRPRDKVWDLFDGDRNVAKCRFCSWRTDHPKAFRMRTHVQSCDAIPQEKKDQLERWQAQKEDKKALKEESGGMSETPSKKLKKDKDEGLRSPITCHVLDSTTGKPAPGMRLRLDRLNTSGFVLLSQGETDEDGRCKDLLPAGSLPETGIFKITFFTSQYFTARGYLSFYPFIEIPFEVKTADEHYHIPLLLSPYAYSTYRGS